MTQLQQRDIKWDNIRGIGIMLVVLGHCLPYQYAINFIFLFHMGLFFFISGYFMKEATIFTFADLLKYIQKKVKSLYIPFVAVNLLILSVHSICIKYNMAVYEYQGLDIFKGICRILLFSSIQNPMLSPLWFLRTIFIDSIFVYIILSLIKSDKIRIIIFFSMYLIGVYIGNNRLSLPLHLEREMVSSFIVYIGYLIKKNQNKEIVKVFLKGNIILTFISFLCLCIASIFFKIDINNCVFSYPLILPITSFIGIIFVIGISNIIKSYYKIYKQICSFGNNSLYILVLHVIAFKIISILIVFIYDLNYKEPSRNLYNMVISDNVGNFWWIVYFSVGILIPMIIMNLIHNIKAKIN